MSQSMEGKDTPPKSHESKVVRLTSALATVADRALGLENAKAVCKAQDFEERAAHYTEAETDKQGKALLFAGKLYMQGGRLDSGTKVLESAIEPLQLYLRRGTLDAYLSLAELYTDLEDAYERRARPAYAVIIRGKSSELTTDIVRFFGPLDTLPSFSDLNRELLSVK